MKRLLTLFAFVSVLLASCVPSAIGAANSCSSLAGEFASTDFGFSSVAAPGLTDSFGPDATFGFGFAGGAFNSTFADPTLGPDPFVATGPFDVVDNEIGFGTNPLLPGVAPGVDQRFECTANGNDAFTLRSRDPLGFDFGNGAEDAIFEGTFNRV